MPETYPVFPSKLETKTRELLIASPQSGRKICAATGLSPGWLSQFATGMYKHYSVGRIERLYEYLSNRELKL